MARVLGEDYFTFDILVTKRETMTGLTSRYPGRLSVAYVAELGWYHAQASLDFWGRFFMSCVEKLGVCRWQNREKN